MILIRIRMPNSTRKKVHKDMLSDLPECIILHILSSLNTKDAVRTCILSSRWKDLWKRLPALSFDYRDFRTGDIFNEFVFKALSLRDSSISLHTLDFDNRICRLEPRLLRFVVDSTILHNVQRFGLSAASGTAQIPPELFSLKTLTHLSLAISNSKRDFEHISLNLPSLTYLKLSIHHAMETPFPNSLCLPTLSTLELDNVTFYVGNNGCAEPFSTFSKLISLSISECTVKGAGTLCISSASLVNFSMYIESDEDDYYKIVLCTPGLRTFAFSGYPYQDISWSNVSSLEHVDIDAEVFLSSCGPPFFLFKWLLEFVNIKSLTVTASTLQALSLIPGLLEFKIPSLDKLKSLRVRIDEIQYGLRMALCEDKLMNIKSMEEAARIKKAFDLGLQPSPLVPDGVVDFLLQNSPSAEVDFVDGRKKKPLKKRNLQLESALRGCYNPSEFRYNTSM
ncbi:F-box/LRR-repeat protein At3g26922-like isoform X1 [Vicia villosa]|uniref:F-box/LRR-repeat protein At3g26922-like isoform X1 n=2 Tax=Vicia villosa TaxID=3911 RepID=UPI00273C16D1|nr:F-box/LRR-repeat protein At3g26922-like isoform X1 [Vicia villosa]